MSLRLFLSGILVGGAIGLMVGGALVQVPADGNGERNYPVFPSMVLAMAGVAGATSEWRGSGPPQPHVVGNGEGRATAPTEPSAAPDRRQGS